MICLSESTIACVMDLSEDKTVHCRLLSNLNVRSNLQDSVVTPTKWTERKTRPSKAIVAICPYASQYSNKRRRGIALIWTLATNCILLYNYCLPVKFLLLHACDLGKLIQLSLLLLLGQQSNRMSVISTSQRLIQARHWQVQFITTTKAFTP